MYIKCPECNEKISDKVLFCPNCGNSINDSSKRKLEQLEDNTKKKRRIICTIGLFIIVFTIIGIIVLELDKSKRLEYKEAITAYTNGNYGVAIDFFANNNYEDSDNYLEKTIKKMSIYSADIGDLDVAMSYLDVVNDDTIRIKLKEKTTYLIAVRLYEKGLFNDAIVLFKSLGTYEDSDNYVKNANLLNSIQGEWYLSDDEFDDKYAKLVIDGCKATLYHYLDHRMDLKEIGRCLLTLSNDRIEFNTNNISYSFKYYERDAGYELTKILVAESYNDNFLKGGYNYMGTITNKAPCFGRIDELEK